MLYGLCACGQEPAVLLMTPQDVSDPWPIGAMCLSQLLERAPNDPVTDLDTLIAELKDD